MSTTPPADIIIATDTIIKSGCPLDNSFENNASDHRGTNAANSDVDNSPNLLTMLMRMPIVFPTTLLSLLLSQSIYLPKLMLPPVLSQTMLT